MGFRSPWVRLGIIALLGAGAFALWLSFQQYERSVRIQREIDTLRHEAERVERENATLSEKIEYFASPDFKEGEAKEKLGLRRQEEKVMAIEGDTAVGLKEEDVSADVSEEIVRHVSWNDPNYLKWWQRFFGK